jgi:hypothetical protein
MAVLMYAWPVVDSFYRLLRLILSNVSQLLAPRGILSEWPITVLVQSSLPGADGCAK